MEDVEQRPRAQQQGAAVVDERERQHRAEGDQGGGEEDLQQDAEHEHQLEEARRQLEGQNVIDARRRRGRVRDHQEDAGRGQDDRRGVEDVRGAAVPAPAHELPGGQGANDQQELAEEVRRLEPQEEVDAAHYRQGAEAGPPLPAPRPLQEHLQRVEDDDLDRDERQVLPDRGVVEPQVQVVACLHPGLEVVGKPDVAFDPQSQPTAPRPEEHDRLPAAQAYARGDERGHDAAFARQRGPGHGAGQQDVYQRRPADRGRPQDRSRHGRSMRKAAGPATAGRRPTASNASVARWRIYFSRA